MNICMACGFSNSIEDKYYEACKGLISNLMKDNNSLVFGACGDGMMGYAYTIAKYYNRKVTAIVPKVFKKDLEKIPCEEVVITNNIGERTNALANYSDALLILPGGTGTIYEFFAFVEMKRGQEFDKPIVVYNKCGLFDDALEIINKLCKERFADESVKDLYFVTDNEIDVINYIYNYKKTTN